MTAGKQFSAEELHAISVLAEARYREVLRENKGKRDPQTGFFHCLSARAAGRLADLEKHQEEGFVSDAENFSYDGLIAIRELASGRCPAILYENCGSADNASAFHVNHPPLRR